MAAITDERADAIEQRLDRLEQLARAVYGLAARRFGRKVLALLGIEPPP